MKTLYKTNQRKVPLQRVTQADIADELGVAVSTVQRALANSSRISEKTKRKVWNLAEKYGYKPSVIANAFARRKTNMIGVILGRHAINHMEVFAAIEQEANRAGYNVLLGITDYNEENEHQKVLQMVEHSVDGLIIASANPLWDMYNQLVESGTAVVFFMPRFDIPFAPSVMYDREYANRIATEHLISLGHRTIAFVDADSDCESARAKPIRGYLDAIARAGINVDERYIYYVKPRSDVPAGENRLIIYENGFLAGEYLFSMNPRPSGIVVEGDELAAGLIGAARKFDVRIPEDVSIVSSKAGKLLSQLTPRVSGVAEPHYQMGRLLTKRVIDMIESPNSPIERISILKGELILRESTKKVDS